MKIQKYRFTIYSMHTGFLSTKPGQCVKGNRFSLSLFLCGVCVGVCVFVVCVCVCVCVCFGM